MRGVLSEKPPQLQVYGVIAQWQTSSPMKKWAASLVVSRVRAAGIEEDEKDTRKRVTRFVRERRKAHLNAKASTVPAAQLVVAEEAASSSAWRRNECGLLWASGHKGRPDAKARKLMAASSTAQPPGVVKTLTDDKKRKRQVKKRRGKKLTVGGGVGGGGGGSV
eukprot:jgi/Tetstr1/454492/TSEL_041392.t1